ncbi:MAG: metal-sensitive transcriptional regulator [Rickettsiaceae bacterium]|nr:metal-sensitive transcriptional regulator [Rickettsiaceae bacterium]
MSTKSKVSHHACHHELLPNLNRINGQVQGVKNMIEQQRYCPDIIQQLSAVRAAIRSLELKILDKHISNCVSEAFIKQDKTIQQQKIDEICKLIKKI